MRDSTVLQNFCFKILHFVVKRVYAYCENVGYNIKHDDGFYNAFFTYL
jgi:hypothetical protein